MPFGSLERPSLAASQIKGYIRATGNKCDVGYANLRFAQSLGFEFYEAIAKFFPVERLFGDWLFVRSAFGNQTASERYIDEVLLTCRYSKPLLHGFLKTEDPDEIKGHLHRVRDVAEKFVQDVADSVVAYDPDVAGATTMFQQNTAAIALLRAIKEKNPAIKTVLGGSNCEDPMGSALEKICPWIDYIQKGRVEGHIEEIFNLDCEPGSHHGNDAYPDFDNYFEQLFNLPAGQWVRPSLPIETSTGCWYGEKKHCTFCGLNGQTMKFKFRDADDVLAELKRQCSRYNIRKFMAVDNIISMDYFKTLLPKLKGSGLDLSLFFETKANLKAEQVKMLGDAGVRLIQPGIEALDDLKLKRFRKGTDLKTNLVLLKNALEQGISVSWNLLASEPGEQQDEYDRQAAIIPKIVHLMPPSGISPILYNRFSPYHFDSAEFGLDLEPCLAYRYIYPPDTDLDQLAYYFEDKGQDRLGLENASVRSMAAEFGHWREMFHGARHSDIAPEPQVLLQFNESATQITDSRRPGATVVHHLNEEEANILEALHDGMTKTRFDAVYPDFDLSSLMERDLVFDTGKHFISLVVRPPQRELPGLEDFPMGWVLKPVAAP